MARHKAGLHKEVAMIFDGVWTPQIDNTHQFLEAPAQVVAEYVHPKPIALKKPSIKAKKPTDAKPSRRISWDIFSKKARKEKKRLSSISKNLLINLPD